MQVKVKSMPYGNFSILRTQMIETADLLSRPPSTHQEGTALACTANLVLWCSLE